MADSQFDNASCGQLPIEPLPVQPIAGNWLSIEGAQTHCSVALQADGADVCHQGVYMQPRGHAEALPQLVDRVLRQAEISPKALSGLLVSIGPGAFTGLRISVTLAQGLAYAWGVPVVGVSALAALSYVACVPRDWVVGDPSPVMPALCAFDARMGELYVGGYGFVQGEGNGAAASPALLATDDARAHSTESMAGSVPASGPRLQATKVYPAWRPWLPDALLSPDALLACRDKLSAVSDGETLTLVGSGGGYLSALASCWAVPVAHQAIDLTAVDLVRFASEQPHLAPVHSAQALHPMYLRHAVAEPPARLK